MRPDWNSFYFDAIERLGLTPADAEWHADKMMDQLNNPVSFTGYKERDDDSVHQGR